MPDFAALAIDPEYAPALLSVGCYQYGTGRKRQGMDFIVSRTRKPEARCGQNRDNVSSRPMLLAATPVAARCQLSNVRRFRFQKLTLSLTRELSIPRLRQSSRN